MTKECSLPDVCRHQSPGRSPHSGSTGRDIARARLERSLQDQEPVRISRQVLRENLAVVTRPQIWPVAINREDALEDVNRLIDAF